MGVAKNKESGIRKVGIKEGEGRKEISLRVKKEGEVLLVEAGKLLRELGYRMDASASGGKITVEKAETEKPTRLRNAASGKITGAIDLARDELIGASLAIHKYAERGNEEFKSSRLLADILEKYGFAVEYGLTGIKDGKSVKLDTAFKAVLSGKARGPSLYIMLEYDALPSGHACGHNLIAASGLAAAAGLSRLMKELPGSLTVIGTPAEDGGAVRGKAPLLEGGHFRGADAVFITHPSNSWSPYSYFLAVNGGVITYRGAASHAARAPERGVNALKAAYLTLNAVDALREHILPESRIHAIISEGGLVPNIVPANARIDIRVRASDASYTRELMKKVENAAKGAAMAVGAGVDIRWRGIQPASLNVPVLNELVFAKAAYLKAFPLVREERPGGSSDLAFVAQAIPTVNLFFKISDSAPHTEAFLRAASSAPGQEAMLAAGKVLALSAFELLNDPAKMKEVKDEFRSLKRGAGKRGRPAGGGRDDD